VRTQAKLQGNNSFRVPGPTARWALVICCFSSILSRSIGNDFLITAVPRVEETCVIISNVYNTMNLQLPVGLHNVTEANFCVRLFPMSNIPAVLNLAVFKITGVWLMGDIPHSTGDISWNIVQWRHSTPKAASMMSCRQPEVANPSFCVPALSTSSEDSFVT
jgi:hypothetical protein